MSENKQEDQLVPWIGTGEIMDLDAMKEALRKMPEKDLALWYVKYFKQLNETVYMIKQEVISRMNKRGGSVSLSPNGQKIKLKIPPKRSCTKEILEAVQEKIKAEHGVDIQLFKVKEEVKPVMSGIKEARELGMDIAMAIAEGLKEEDGNPSLEIVGVDKETAKAFEPR